MEQLHATDLEIFRPANSFASIKYIHKSLKMILKEIRELNSSLDRMLLKSTNAGLNALIPHSYTTRGNLYWIDPNNPSLHNIPTMRNNHDIEQQFHWVYGPYVSEHYESQISAMIRQIVNEKDGYFMCSTVKVDTIFWVDTLSINIIIIRPCLQKRHVFGKILYEIARQLPEDIVLQINNCMPESQRAMDRYYGGSDPDVFKKSNDTMQKRGNDYVTYTLLDRAQFQEIYEALNVSPLPAAIKLNGKETSAEEEVWSRFAEANVNTGFLAKKFVEYQFKIGYTMIDVPEFHNECSKILSTLEQKIEADKILHSQHDITDREDRDAQARIVEIDVLRTKIQNMLDEDNLPNAMLFPMNDVEKKLF